MENKDIKWIPCACGCDVMRKSKDNQGRSRRYLRGHNVPRRLQTVNEYHRDWCRKNRKRVSFAKKRRTQEKKKTLLAMGGNCCVCCGLQYNGTNATVFDFHHRVPEEKEFPLSQPGIHGYSCKSVLTEAKKCDIICANCHRMVHCEEY